MVAVATVHQMLATQSANEIARQLAKQAYNAQLKSISVTKKQKRVIEVEDVSDGKL